MGIIQYPGQHHQNQQRGQQQNQHQQYNTADRRTKQSSDDARPVFKWRQEDEEEERNDRKIDVSRVKVTPISISTASKAQNSQYLFMGQLEELNVPTSGGTAEQGKQLKQLVDKWCYDSCMDAAHVQYSTVAACTFTCFFRLSDRHYRSSIVGACWMSHVSPCLVCPVVPCRNPASIEAGFVGRSRGWPEKSAWSDTGCPASLLGLRPIEAAGMSL
jgi:hypothetical protein